MGIFSKKNTKAGSDTTGIETNAVDTVVQDAPVEAPIPQAAEAQPPKAKGLGTIDFDISYEEDGVYLRLNNDHLMDVKEMEAFVRHLARKEILALDMGVVQNMITKLEDQREKVAPPQDEHCYDETYSVSLGDGQMKAYIMLQPPDPGGGKKLDPQMLIDELSYKYQIHYGLDKDKVLELLKNPVYDEKIEIASGSPAVPGKDGCLIWNFDLRADVDTTRVKHSDDDGDNRNDKVDFKDLDLFEKVVPDQLLVTKVPAEDGVPGFSVLGQEIPPQEGKQYNLPTGKNTYTSDDRLQLFAKVGGRVDYVGGRVEVSDCYYVTGNVDMTVGNIDFDGDVNIAGNVLSGFSVKSGGNVDVMGIVEAANIEASGDIVIRGGIQGAGKGSLVSDGNVFVKFVEYATVQAKQMIVAESLLHSNVNSFIAVEVLNGRGSIIGGNTCAGSYIAARVLGNSSNRTTNVQVGISPAHRARLLEIEEAMKSLDDSIDRLSRYVQRPPDGTESQKQKDMRLEVMRKMLVQKRQKEEWLEEYTDLKEQLADNRGEQIHALDKVYPGVVINIGFAQTVVKGEIAYCTFRMMENDIDMTACRFKQQPFKNKRKKKR